MAAFVSFRLLTEFISYFLIKASIYDLDEISKTCDSKEQSEFCSFIKYHSLFESTSISTSIMLFEKYISPNENNSMPNLELSENVYKH